MRNSKLITFLFPFISLIILTECNKPKEESQQGESKQEEQLSLPLNLKIGYWGPDVQYPPIGLVIEDELGLVVVGKESEFLFNNDTVLVEKIKRIGFDKFRIVAEIEDKKGELFYIECVQNDLSTSTNNLRVTTWNSIDVIEADSLRWVDSSDISHR
ncbi:hypothetical protein LVD15_03920 [Fulvivirga maritima]|uniref:hypothetical protein n=1 Tax=Fulvivirga maritima TaxID=2904247 RepID=UPI001F2EE5B6|nr:hypothetical protein [Fulvivirga maritima]UII27583.1 hypothetical protein LVD15_03920 [Fulvivirga maritima]